MFKWKKATAALAAAALAAASVGCTIGSGTAYAMTIDGMQVNAGIYIYYAYQSYMELKSELQSENSELDVDDDKVVKEQTMEDGTSAEEWIKNKALEYCQDYVAVEKKFEELDLSLDEDDQTDIDSTMTSFWETNGDLYEKNGMSENSITSVLENIYKTNELFLYYYDVDGEEGVTEDEVKEYYVDNNARVRYIKFSLTDGNGDELDDAGKEDMMDMVKDYLKQIEKAGDDEDAVDEAMDAVQSDYNAYVTSISEEAAAETATSATDEDGNEIAATTTTTAATTTSTTATTTTTAETTVAAEDADSEETTTAAEEDSDSDSETTTTTVSTDSDSTDTEETTTTTAKYANEQIIAKVTTDEDTTEEDLTYSPSETVYNYIFDEAEIDVPAIVEDTDNSAYYIVVRRNIEDRMNEDDLWTESQRQAVVSAKYEDSFLDMQEEWRGAQTVEKNESAIKRYDAFKLEMDSSSTAS